MANSRKKSRDKGFGYQICEYNPAYDESKLRSEIKIGATYKIVETIKPDRKSGIYSDNQYVLCSTTGEILQYRAEAIIGLIGHGLVINAWVRQKGSKKRNSLNSDRNVEIVVTQLDQIKGKQPNLEQKIVPNKDQTIERLKAFEIIQRYNRKISLLGLRPQLQFDILRDGSIRINKLLDNSIEVLKIPNFVRYIKTDQFRKANITKLIYDNPVGVPQNLEKLFSVQDAMSIEIYMQHPDEIVSTQQMFNSCRNLQTVKFVNFTWRNLKTASDMFRLCGSLYQVDLGDTQTTSKLEDINNMFYGCTQLRDFKFIENMDVHNVTDARQAFSGCGMVQKIDFSRLNFCNVTLADNLFTECVNLTSIKLGKNFGKLVSQTNMFQRCKQLEQIDLQGTDFSSLRDMVNMFAQDQMLHSVNLGNINFKSLTNCQNIFDYCTRLETVNLQKTYFPEVESMQGMFKCCQSVKNIRFEPQRLSKLTDIGRIVYLCNSLESINFEDLDMPKLTTLDEIAYKAENLKTLKFNKQVHILKYVFSMLQNQRVEKLYLPGINLIGLGGVEDVEQQAVGQKNIKAYTRKNKDDSANQKEVELNKYETQFITTLLGEQAIGLTYIPDMMFNDCIVYRKDIIRSFGYIVN